jgi:ATP-dependent protease HslVU (ClpYQ) peptidase subunit
VKGGLYFTDAAAALHRLTALQALDLVRRAVSAP